MRSVYLREYRKKAVIIDPQTLKRFYVDCTHLNNIGWNVTKADMFSTDDTSLDLPLVSFSRHSEGKEVFSSNQISIIYKELKYKVTVDYGCYGSWSLCGSFMSGVRSHGDEFAVDYVCRLGNGKYETVIKVYNMQSGRWKDTGVRVKFELGADLLPYLGVGSFYKTSDSGWKHAGYFNPITPRQAILSRR